MKLIITHALTETGSEFHKQKLYHVPEETVRQIASDFESFSNASPRSETHGEISPCTTYEYDLEAPQSEDNDQADGSARTERARAAADDIASQQKGVLTVDFRSVVAVQGYHHLS